MKRTLLTVVCAMICATTFAQKDSGFGVKAGLNYSANGNYFESVGDAARNPDRNIGYHVGVFGKLGNRFYFRPELIYTKTQSDYDGDKLDIKKLDLPLLVGAKVIGPVHVFAGPAFQYLLSEDFDGISINRVEDDFTVGLHIGAGVNLGKLGFDIRYERGFSENEASFVNTNVTSLPTSRVDTRPDQLIVGLSVKF